MPALQVREFPKDLYAQLREYASSQHRSIAQQTIIAVDQMLNASDYAVPDSSPLTQANPAQRSSYLDSNTEAERSARAEKRKRLLGRCASIPWTGAPPTGQDIVRIVREGREERSSRIIESVDAGNADSHQPSTNA